MNTWFMPRIRTVVIEDDNLLRSGICSGLTLQGIDVVGSSGDAASALRVARATQPDAAVIDLDLGAGPSGVDLALALRSAWPTIGLTMLTSYEHPRLAGISAAGLPPHTFYCVKQHMTDLAQLAKTVRQSVESDAVGVPMSRIGSLTDDQMDILRMVAQGMTNAQIAEVQVLSEKAIEHAVRRIADTLSVSTNGGSNPRVMLTRKYFALIGASRES